jgi:DNA-directed RNA polymerase specialized sigma subunit
MTQAEIAETLGISPERVQQLLVQGLNRLKESCRQARLEPYR